MSGLMIRTTKGELPQDTLRIVKIVNEDDDAQVLATEYYLDEELVRRDVHVTLRRGVESGAAARRLE